MFAACGANRQARTTIRNTAYIVYLLATELTDEILAINNKATDAA